MASPFLLRSVTSSFHGQSPLVSAPVWAGVPNGSHGVRVVSVKAATGTLVEKSESEKVSRLKATYLEKIVPKLKEEFSYQNIHEVPKIEKIVVNCGIGDAQQNAKGLEAAMNDMALITGQRPVKTRARASIATFKIREDQPLGIAVTLRGNIMYSFIDRLINLALPRTRDFQGVNANSFDGHGNYSIGIREQSVFPEIRFDVLGKPRGMDVCIVTTAKTDQEGYKLLSLMGMPFREGGGPTTSVRKKKLKAHHFDSKSKGRSRSGNGLDAYKLFQGIHLTPTMFFLVICILLVALLAWARQAIRPPSPKVCGSPGGPLVTAPRIKLRDGRHMAYKEHGVPKEVAKYKIIYIHGFRSYRHDLIIEKSFSPEFFQEEEICLVSYDRPGYGESDPHPKQTVKSLALDIEELADQLELGSKFYVMGNSVGAQLAWGCLKYISSRLAGAALVSPIVNFWWKGFPTNLSTDAYYKQLPQDQWAVRVAHYIPWLTYWWNTQKWFPAATAVVGNINILTPQDLKIMSDVVGKKISKGQATQQGLFESMHRTFMIGVGNWEFSPLDLRNPFPNNEGSVHVWQGDEDRIAPVKLQRYIVDKLPWIKYHELSGSGHFFSYAAGMGEVIVKALICKE